MTIKKAKDSDFPVATLELTYRCPLHCEHCFIGCYNYPQAFRNELSTAQIKAILDKCRDGGIEVLGLTGGDPLVRKDFAELYKYARKLGFITIVFTSLTSLGKSARDTFKKYPPFQIQTTLNAASPETYREITKTALLGTQVNNIRALLKMGIAVKVKTQVTRQNVSEIGRIETLVKTLGVKFNPALKLCAPLVHSSCYLRIEPNAYLNLYKKYANAAKEDSIEQETVAGTLHDIERITPKSGIIRCLVTSGKYITISAEGKLIPCIWLRKPEYNLLENGHTIAGGIRTIRRTLRRLYDNVRIKCATCDYRSACQWCPGLSYLETGTLKPIQYFCTLAKAKFNGSR
jgi:radical SAM protein with 4Fe4S-binding SPASM domain